MLRSSRVVAGCRYVAGHGHGRWHRHDDGDVVGNGHRDGDGHRRLPHAAGLRLSSWAALGLVLLSCSLVLAQSLPVPAPVTASPGSPDAGAGELPRTPDEEDQPERSGSLSAPLTLDTSSTLDPEQGPGLVDQALRRLALSQNAEALRLFSRKDYPRALEGFRGAYALDPLEPEITNNLAYLYHLLGNLEAAERFYRETLLLDRERGVAHLNFADLLSVRGASQEQLAEAAEHLTRARELRGNQAQILLRQARVAARRGRFAEAERHYRERLALPPVDDALRLEIGDLYRDHGRWSDALGWYREVRAGRMPPGETPATLLPSVLPGEVTPAGDPTGPGEDLGRAAAQRIWEIEVSRQARRFGWTPRSESVPGNVHVLAGKGRILLHQQRFEEAEPLLREAVGQAPELSSVRADLGDLLRRTGREQEAELQYLRAAALDQGNAEIPARLGELYLAWPEGGRGAEAALFFERARTLRPDWTELHLRLAEAYRVTGDLTRALHHLERYLPTAEDGAARERALALRRALLPLREAGDRAAPGTLATEHPGKETPPAPASEDDQARRPLLEALGRARVLLARGEPEAAMAELARLEEGERLPAILNLEAQVLHAAGRPEEAAALWQRSLALDERQVEVHEQLGLIRAEQGRTAEARQHLEQAESLGSAAATHRLARLLLPAVRPAPVGWLTDLIQLGALLRAEQRLEQFLSEGRSPLQAEEAAALRDAVVLRKRAALGFAGLLLACALGALLLALHQLWGGSDLRRLVARHPEAGPEMQRLLSAIRHEVLKHNTLVLSGLVERLGQVEAARRPEEASPGTDTPVPVPELLREVAQTAAYCRSSLFGTASAPGGAASRLRDYVDELERLGRSHGERLNLRRKDAALSALLAGFALLEQVAPLLDRVDRLTRRERSRLTRTLRQAARLLNQQGYEAVRSLLDELRVLKVEKGLLTGIFERTCREPAFQGLRCTPLELELEVELPCALLIPRPAFEDIFTNLVRNALQSSLRHGASELGVGLAVRAEVDPITGLERIAFHLRDRSPQVLTTEMIRGRYIEEGLGLTADLVSRYEGTLDVFPGEGGWAKAVVVKLPRLEQGLAEEGA